MMKYSIVLIALFVCFSIQAQYNKEVVLETLLKTDTNSIGQRIEYPTFEHEEVTILKVTIPSGASTGWHEHDFPVFAYLLQGELTVEVENKKTKKYKANTTFAEVVNTLHTGINCGKEDVVLIAFFMGANGKPLSIHAH